MRLFQQKVGRFDGQKNWPNFLMNGCSDEETHTLTPFHEKLHVHSISHS